MRTRQRALGSPAGLRLRLGLGLGTQRPRPASQVSLELWAPASQRDPERPRVCPATPEPSTPAPVRRDPLAVAFPGVATFWGAGLRGEGEYRPFFPSPRPHCTETPGDRPPPSRPTAFNWGREERVTNALGGLAHWLGALGQSHSTFGEGRANPPRSSEREPPFYPEKRPCFSQFDRNDV